MFLTSGAAGQFFVSHAFFVFSTSALASFIDLIGISVVDRLKRAICIFDHPFFAFLFPFNGVVSDFNAHFITVRSNDLLLFSSLLLARASSVTTLASLTAVR